MVLETSKLDLPVTRPRFTTGSSSVIIMRSTGSTIFHLPASFRHHLHLCILCIHHFTSLHVNNFLRVIIVYTPRERRRRRHSGGLEVACTTFDTRPSLRTSSPSWGLHRRIRQLLVYSAAIFGHLHFDTKNRSTAALTSLHPSFCY